MKEVKGAGQVFILDGPVSSFFFNSELFEFTWFLPFLYFLELLIVVTYWKFMCSK